MVREILILGAAGLLGRALLRHVPPDVRIHAPEAGDLPLEAPGGIAAYAKSHAVDGVLLTAAWTQVDACESDPDRAFRINGILPGEIATRLRTLRVPLLFVSTDYVFDGTAERPYREFDPPSPRSTYGASKWHGECAVREAGGDWRIVRTAALYGPGGPDFVGAIRERLRAGPVTVVTDEIAAPTLVDDLAPALWRILLAGRRGTWHVTAAGEVSRFDCARRIAVLSGVNPERIHPTTREALGRPAPRPGRSILDCSAAAEAFGIRLPSWEDGLRRFLGGGPSAGEDAAHGGTA